MAASMGFEPMLLDGQSRVLDLTERWSRGAGDRNWTRDLKLTKLLLYQLSYTSVWVDGRGSNPQPSEPQSDALPFELPSTLVGEVGIEPTTSTVSEWHSNLLNYSPIGGERWSWTITVSDGWFTVTWARHLLSLPIVYVHYNKIPFHCQDKSWSFFEG